MTSANITETLFFTQVTPKQTEQAAAPANDQFKNILAKQTESVKKPEAGKTEIGKSEAEKTETVKYEQAVENARPKTVLSKKSDSVESTPSTEQSLEEIGADMQMLEDDIDALSTDIMACIAEIFGATPNQVETFAEQQGIEPNELLDMEILGEFTRQFAEVENPLELLTNEQAFQNFKDVMEFAKTGLESLSEQYQLPIKEIQAVAIQNVVVQDSFEGSVQVVGNGAISLEAEMIAEESNITVTNQFGYMEDAELLDTNRVTELGEKEISSENLEDGAEAMEATQHPQTKQSSQGMQQEEQGNADSSYSHNQFEANTKTQTKTVNIHSDATNATNTANTVSKAQTKDTSIDVTQTGGRFVFNPLEQPFQETQNILSYEGTDSRISTEDIMRQLMDYMKVSVKPDASDLEMQLHPQSLGNVQIHIANKEGTITAQFTTENEAVRATLEGQMIQLKERFEEQGIKVETIEVTVETHSFDQNLGQNQSQGEEGYNGQQRKATRSILDTSLSEEEMELLSDEDRLKLRMMESNGNQVDYKA